MINIFNTEKLLKVCSDFPIKHIKESLEREFNVDNAINIIFITQEQIKKLNQEYRNTDQITDVLSFNIESSSIFGEIYICPKYVANNTDPKKLESQLIRILIHGILHLQGYDHKKEFDEVDYKNEPMYIKQEEILDKILKNKKDQ
jgi:probable rRNA maturation factor